MEVDEFFEAYEKNINKKDYKKENIINGLIQLRNELIHKPKLTDINDPKINYIVKNYQKYEPEYLNQEYVDRLFK